MKNNSIKIFTILVVTLILNSCCKDENPTLAGCQKLAAERYRYNLGNAIKYMNAKAGSYWIYKNTKTGVLDTQTCLLYKQDSFSTSTVAGIKKKARQITIVYDRIFFSIYSTYNNWTYINSTNEVIAHPDGIFKSITSINSTVFLEGTVVPFFYPLTIDLAGGGTGSSYTTLKEIIPSYTLLGKTYQNVAVFEVNRDGIWYPSTHPIATQYPKSRYYWAENVGLIKRENVSEKYSWELIEFDIIK